MAVVVNAARNVALKVAKNTYVDKKHAPNRVLYFLLNCK